MSHRIEFLCALADNVTHAVVGEPTWYDDEEDSIRYTEEAQEVFNEWYDLVDGMLDKYLEGNAEDGYFFDKRLGPRGCLPYRREEE